MMGSCSYIDLQLNRRGGRLMIGSAYERVYTVSKYIWPNLRPTCFVGAGASTCHT